MRYIEGMNFLAIVVTLASFHANECAAVDPLNNQAAWTRGGITHTATYTDRDRIRYNKRVPRVVWHLTTQHSGTAIRLQCGH